MQHPQHATKAGRLSGVPAGNMTRHGHSQALVVFEPARSYEGLAILKGSLRGF
jgi:hypothetical protein